MKTLQSVTTTSSDKKETITLKNNCAMKQSLPEEVCDCTCACQHTPKSVYVYENLYVQISVTNIASYGQKLSSQKSS